MKEKSILLSSLICLFLVVLLAGCRKDGGRQEPIAEQTIHQEYSLETEEWVDEGDENPLYNETPWPGDSVAGSSNANYGLENQARDIARNGESAANPTEASRSAAPSEGNNVNNNGGSGGNNAGSNATLPQSTLPYPTQGNTIAPVQPGIPSTAVTPETTTPAASGNYAEAEARRVLDLVNEARRSQGLSELTWNSSLAASANVRAEEIKISFSHTRPDGSSFSTVNSLARGENIAYGYRQLSTSQEVFQGWMNSPGHRENILRSSFRTLGVGCYVVNGYYYWVQLFGN